MQHLFKSGIGCLLFVLTAISLPGAYTYSAYTGMTGEKSFALNPSLYLWDLSDQSSWGADAVIAYGILDNFDVYAELGGFYGLNNIPDVNPYYFSFVMPRYDFGGSNIAALELGITRDADNNIHFYAGPQYHYSWENSSVALEANATFYTANNPIASSGGMCASAIFGAAWKAVPDIFCPYLEIDPVYDLGDGSGLDLMVTPGVWLGVRGTSHQISIGFPINGIATGPFIGVACWYWISFGGKE